MIFGFYGIFFELYSPGWGVSGTLGVICLLLAFFGLAVLPVNYLGLALLIVGLALFVAEAFVTSFGALTVAGLVCLVLGGVMLVDSPIGFMRVSLSMILPVAVATAVIVVFLMGGVIRAHLRRARTGDEGMVGVEVPVREDFTKEGDRYIGSLFFHGEWWRAACDGPLAAGQSCTVQSRDGLTLQVKPGHDRVTEESVER
jgi:membrane-bound serine protease (ClpP class)